MFNKTKEALLIASHINALNKGFVASAYQGGDIQVNWSGTINYDASSFQLVLEPSVEYGVYTIMNSSLSNTVNMLYHRDPIAYFTLELSRYNVKLNKRIEKTK